MRVAGWIGLALALACGAVFARDLSEVREVRKQLEASMLIKGTITVDPEGKVRGFDLVEQDKLPVEVVELIRGTTLQWRFEPVVIDGKPVVTKTDMNVRVVAQPWSDDQLRIRIAGATFGEVAPTPDETLRPSNLSPPDYPEAAWRANAGGTVYVVLKIARTGKVEEAVVEQVNLGVVGTDKEIASLRDMFAKNALAQARRWTFIPPTAGPDADNEFWSARVPVVYSKDNSRRDKKLPVYGKWQAYLPGPRHPIPWAMKSEGLAFSPDAVPEGSVHMAGSGLKLLTAPES